MMDAATAMMMQQSDDDCNSSSASAMATTDDEDYDCDYDEIELVVQGREIVVSERVLCKHSRYFAQVFGALDPEEETVVLRHGRLEGEDDITDEQEAEPLTLISYATMKTIVDFLDSGRLKIGEQNVKHLMLASDLLAIGDVEIECFNFLKENLNLQTCVRHYVLADAKRSWSHLARHIEHYIQLQFAKLRNQTQLYQLTNAEQFGRIISHECLAVKKEEEVLEAALEWVNYDLDERRHQIAEILGQVQWPLIRNSKALKDALSNPIIASNSMCSHYVTSAIKYNRMSYEDRLNYWADKRKPTRWPKLMTALSYADKLIECFDFEEQRWFALTEKPSATFGAEMLYADGKIYTLGGVQTKQVNRYDVENDVWDNNDYPSLTQFRVAHGAVAYEDKLYVMGGSAKASADFGPGLDEMEALDPASNSSGWSTVGSMLVGRSYLASSAGEGKIYMVGGCLTEKVSTAECYDVETQTYRRMPNTLSKRDSLGLAYFDGQLFAVGGYDNHENAYLNSVEKYDPQLDVWLKVKSMQMGRRSPGVVIYRSKLYAVGGMGATEDLKSVEVYDPIINQWTKFPFPMKEICGKKVSKIGGGEEKTAWRFSAEFLLRCFDPLAHGQFSNLGDVDWRAEPKQSVFPFRTRRSIHPSSLLYKVFL